MFCYNCGAKIEGQVFCYNCGSEIIKNFSVGELTFSHSARYKVFLEEEKDEGGWYVVDYYKEDDDYDDYDTLLRVKYLKGSLSTSEFLNKLIVELRDMTSLPFWIRLLASSFLSVGSIYSTTFMEIDSKAVDINVSGDEYPQTIVAFNYNGYLVGIMPGHDENIRTIESILRII